LVANKFQLAEAFTEFTVKGFALFKSQMKQAKALAASVAAPFLKLGSIIGRAFSPLKLAIGGLGAGAGIFGLLKLASTAEEVRNRFRLVFDDMADETDKFVVNLGSQFKRSTTELRDSLAAYQGYFIGLKIGNKTAAELSKTMLRLQLDFQSVADLSTTETQQKLLSTLAGMALPMRKYGIDIQEAAIQQELLAAGLDKTTAGASRQGKALASMKIIMDTMQRQKTIGDLPRTMGSMANQARAMLDMFTELGETLGNFLTPIFKELAGLASAFAQVFKRAASGALPKVQGILDSIGSLIRGIAEDVRTLNFTNFGSEITGIIKRALGGFGRAFLLTMQAGAKILLLAGSATGKAIAAEIAKLLPNLPASVARQLGLTGFGRVGRIVDGRVVRDPAKTPQTFGQQVGAIVTELGDTLKTIAEANASEATATIKDEFGNLLTRGQQAQIAANEKAAKQGTDLIGRLLQQLAAGGKKLAEDGQGAFAAIGFASLQKHMQNIISKGEEEAIKLAKRAEEDRGKIIELLEDPQIQPAAVGP